MEHQCTSHRTQLTALTVAKTTNTFPTQINVYQHVLTTTTSTQSNVYHPAHHLNSLNVAQTFVTTYVLPITSFFSPTPLVNALTAHVHQHINSHTTTNAYAIAVILIYTPTTMNA